MTLIQPPMMVKGGTHPARTMRMMIRDLSRGAQGVTEYNDLKVTQQTTPGAGVQVGDGSGVVRGAAWGQGSYTQYNVGTALVNIAPTGAQGRTDMVVLRVQDPEYEGSLNPASDDIGFFDVVSNVSSTATQPPAGMTAIPLARIALPSNCATVTNAMITDLRRIANPRRDRQLYTAFPGSPLNRIVWQDNQWHTWPSAAHWNIAVPVWAVSAKLVTTVAGLRLDSADVFASMRQVLGIVTGQGTAIDDDQGANTRRSTVVVADSLTIPFAMRGTTQSLYLQTFMSKAETGNLGVDNGTSLITDVEFEEGVV
ncbi:MULTISPECIES: hypothetical protein [unclassified Streptomyces]|uniref:hypothetical protein n=1 Tax=unclassified Streptomyces TaxID=2593676 RepID=UPI002E813254|nr:hypothetical protein [Streptomyces sp. NBC_00589]WTI37438.1 hypothetical protein OIC96_21685 [Streptomyces sp. NBC_00775]WUB28885.1 hypothetical protein OHA51_28050 [Streptomyces sp. NBC_00589]